MGQLPLNTFNTSVARTEVEFLLTTATTSRPATPLANPVLPLVAPSQVR